MCGISGYYSNNNTYTQDVVEDMNNALNHRGPDAGGIYTCKIAGLGHRRLSILDLSANANQPMTSANGRYIMVYNGEVYNYQELANELQKQSGIQLKTTSDSEVILETIALFGHESIKQFNGMFALALYDTIKEELIITRDRMGIKPLYYYWNNGDFLFASELKSLMTVNSLPKKIDKNAVNLYLSLGCIPAPLSIFENVRKLEPAEIITISKSGIQATRYWNLSEYILPDTITSEPEAKTKLNALIDSSVEMQMNCDVDFGIFLSGGIDSSLIAAKASRISKSKINTFSIGFKENKYNEAAYAKTIADHLKTHHHEFIVSYNDALDLVETLNATYDEPFADPSAIPTALVSRLAKKHVSVALSGEGGDELFLGYGAYVWARRLNQNKFLHAAMGKALKLANKPKHALYFQNNTQENAYSHIFSQEQDYFSVNEINQLLKEKNAYSTNAKTAHFFDTFYTWVHSLKRKLDPMEQQALFDLNFSLQNDLLTKVDRASMRFSLETRVPYLDNRIIELALNIAPNLKYRNKTHKYILKSILFDHLPASLFDRPKQGFALPVESWLKKELKHLIEDTLSKKNINEFGLVDSDYVQTLIKDFYKGKSHVYKRIWQLIILHKWMIQNKHLIHL